MPLLVTNPDVLYVRLSHPVILYDPLVIPVIVRGIVPVYVTVLESVSVESSLSLTGLNTIGGSAKTATPNKNVLLARDNDPVCIPAV